ncbi:MAG: hypothetical protein [Wendovervirus sonii]|uniref:Uncharacterized protein n=1 Tax=phage Lak_Megaphage_Sonny TaxID=3109229 RepID=A0ABZ0Z237_9CAUD|nr:MAG: hypothetical protein [phage Lak_Megaphage_Sonny]
MTNEEILKLENNRTQENVNMIYLIKDNNNWYKAYEWSAFLLEFYPDSTAGKLLKPNKRHFSTIDTDLIYVSLQLPSLEKYAAGATYNKDIKDDLVPIIVDISKYKNLINANAKEVFNNWKNSIEIKETIKKLNTEPRPERKVFKSSEIEQKILSFQYYNLEKDDLINFIIELKNMCATRI